MATRRWPPGDGHRRTGKGSIGGAVCPDRRTDVVWAVRRRHRTLVESAIEPAASAHSTIMITMTAWVMVAVPPGNRGWCSNQNSSGAIWGL